MDLISYLVCFLFLTPAGHPTLRLLVLRAVYSFLSFYIRFTGRAVVPTVWSINLCLKHWAVGKNGTFMNPPVRFFKSQSLRTESRNLYFCYALHEAHSNVKTTPWSLWDQILLSVRIFTEFLYSRLVTPFAKPFHSGCLHR